MAVPNLLQAVLLTGLVFLTTAAAVSGTLLLMSRLEAALPSSPPDR